MRIFIKKTHRARPRVQMLIIGEKYTFTHYDKKILQNNRHTLTLLKEDILADDEGIKKLNVCIQDNTIIIMNTKKNISFKQFCSMANTQINELQYYTVERFLETYLGKCYLSYNDTNVHHLKMLSPYTPWQYTQKKCIDYLGVFVLAFCSIPLVGYSYYRIKKESPGNSIYTQKRVGLCGHEFSCVKLRSMCMDAETQGIFFSSKDDTRVFKWGKFMRKMHIDELPQLFNVLRGEMHLVGPRPERKVWVEQFEQKLPSYKKRHLVKPGITGLAQIVHDSHNDGINAREKLMYDLYYVKHWSLLLELKVLWKTCLIILK